MFPLYYGRLPQLICKPIFTKTVKLCLRLAITIVNTPYNVLGIEETFHGDLRSVAESAQKLDKNVILSCEIISYWDHNKLVALRESFERFDVTIVWTYREILSRLKSSWAERARVSAIMSEGSFVMDQLSEYSKVLSEVSTFSSMFGDKNVVILDFFGILDAEADIAQVFVCEIAGVLCNSEPLNGSAPVNVAWDMEFVALFEQVLAHAAQMSCKLSQEQIHNLRHKIHTDYQEVLANAEPNNPQERTDTSAGPSAAVERGPSKFSVPVDVLQSYAANLERQFRSDTGASGADGKYKGGITWYYSNVQANDRARAEVLLSGVDAWTLTNAAVGATKPDIDRTKTDSAADSAISIFWNNWITVEVRELSKSDKYMSDCFRSEKSLYHRVSQFDSGHH